MITEQNEYSSPSSSMPRWLTVVIAIVVAISIGALWSSVSTRMTANQQAGALRADVQQLQQRLGDSERGRQAAETQIALLSEQLHRAQGQLGATQRQNGELRKDLTNVQGSVNGVKEQLAGKANGADVEAISTNMNNVRSDVNAVGEQVKGVRTDLDATSQSLKMARSELGTLIARNHDEIDQLRRLGQREYFEFTLEGRNEKTQVGGVTVVLRGTNTKRQVYSVTLIVDDVSHYKKNRPINEPIIFHRAGSRQSLELVINKVENNKLTGYLSAPKYPAAAIAAGE